MGREKGLGNLRWTDLGKGELCFRFRVLSFWLLVFLVIGYFLLTLVWGK